jgi:F-type H+-transporting ATPase subunit b
MIGARLIGIANLIGAEDHHFDDQGYTTHDPWLPEQAELIYGSIASLIVFFLLWKYARKPAADGMKARTSRIQEELDEAAQAKSDADADAAGVRQALGDIQSERRRLLAEADAQAQSLLADGRARLEAEVVELEAKADADIQAGAGRVSDELRNEIARYASRAADQVVEQSLDASTQQHLIEDFIARVGAGS